MLIFRKTVLWALSSLNRKAASDFIERWFILLMNFPEYKKPDHNIKGIFWDFDGTLVDSRDKNFNVTKIIVKRVTGRSPESFPILKSADTYQQALRKSTNWRDFYHNFFELSIKNTDYAGSLWSKYQLRDNTHAPVFEGIPQLLDEFRDLDHAIISQNSKNLIRKILDENNLQKYFKFIIGYEEVNIRNQKPDPAGLIKSMGKFEQPISGIFIYIGDHESDVTFAGNANSYLKANNFDAKVISVAAHYHPKAEQHTWKHSPDFHAHTVSELRNVLRRVVLE